MASEEAPTHITYNPVYMATYEGSDPTRGYVYVLETARPVAPVSPDATDKCGELVTELWRCKKGDYALATTTDGAAAEDWKKHSSVEEYVTRSQAEELLAAERAEVRHWQEQYTEMHSQFIDLAKSAEADNAAKVEQERLRFEGDLDKWMKIIGAGITGYQPEAYALMDLACEELVKLRADNAALTAEISAISGHLDCEADSDSILHTIREIEADKEIYKERAEALEAKLAAAEKALEEIASDTYGEEGRNIARAALGGKPSC
ncbi:hypothetical protein [Brucella intermedia]|uniref:hypothetical protein n=1 Tax=Brucella intermedia TaxID=94625 RepID=UPI00235FA202|nr:hypothetical protein [Brucella intermedia]